MQSEKPNFYAIIPANVRYCEEITPWSKLLYWEITALSDRTWFCYATNRYFSELYWVNERTIQRWIFDLQNLWFINIEVENFKRKIYIEGMTKMSWGYDKNVVRLWQKCRYINIDINTKNSIYKKSDKKDLERMQKMSQFNIQ